MRFLDYWSGKFVQTQKNYLKQKSLIASPVNCDGHHVHERGRYIAIEEERENSAERGSQGPSLVNIPRYHSVTTDNK